jgi:hypothetical protein
MLAPVAERPFHHLGRGLARDRDVVPEVAADVGIGPQGVERVDIVAAERMHHQSR